MAIIGLFQCDPWCLPTQNWLKNATNDISIQEFHNTIRHYVKDTGLISPYDKTISNITWNLHTTSSQVKNATTTTIVIVGSFSACRTHREFSAVNSYEKKHSINS